MSRTHGADPAPAAVTAALTRLGIHADALAGGWAPSRWRRRTGGVESTVRMSVGPHLGRHHAGRFEELDVAVGQAMRFETRLDPPDRLHGVDLVGEQLFVTINSFWPVELRLDGQEVFADSVPVVANGPALVPLGVPFRGGDAGSLTLDVLPSPIPLGGMWAQSGLVLSITSEGVQERLRLVDLLWARLMLAVRFADTADRRAATGRAAALVPQELAAAETSELADRWGAGSALAEELAWLDEPLSRFTIHAVGHAHTDLTWLWTFEDARRVIQRDIASVLDLMDDYPDFRFTHSQAAGYAALEADRPELFARMRHRIDEGRFESAALQWAEPDNNIPSGPAHLRQLLEGQRYLSGSLGTTSDVWLAPDAFGHAGNLPQLAASAGARTYYHHRANRGFDDDEDPRYAQARWWEGVDGSRVLTLATPLYLGPVRASLIARDLIALGADDGQTEVCFFFGVGDHGGGPTRLDLDTIALLDDAALFPGVRCSTVTEFTDALLSSGSPIPTVVGESDTVFEGCYISHADGKRWNRAAENALQTAETLAALAGADVAEQLSAAWRPVLFDQFHDVAGGASVAAAYDEQADRAAAALHRAAEITDHAALALSRPEAATALVVNPTGSQLASWIEVPGVAGPVTAHVGDGPPLPTQTTEDGVGLVVELPAFSTSTVRFEPSEEQPGLIATAAAGGLRVATPDYVADVDSGSGAIAGYRDARSGRRIVGRADLSPESLRQQRPDLGIGVLVRYREAPHVMSSWMHDLLESEQSLIRGATVTLAQNGPLRSQIHVDHSFGASTARLVWTFYRDLPWIDLQIVLDWAEGGPAADGIPGLAVSFASRLRSPELWTEGAFCAVPRETDGFLKPMHRWADIGSDDGGVAVANDGKYGVDGLGPRMRVHLVRSTHDPDPAADHVLSESGRYRILIHEGSWRDHPVVPMAESLNQPPLVLPGRAAVERSVTLPEPHHSIRLTGLSRDPVGRLVTVAYESHGRPGDLWWPAAAVVEHDLRDREVQVHRCGPDGRVRVSFRAFEMKRLTPLGSAGPPQGRAPHGR